MLRRLPLRSKQNYTVSKIKMGQIFNRIKKITKSYLNDNLFNENSSEKFLNDDEELKKIIDNLSSDNNTHPNQFQINKMNTDLALKILGINSNASIEQIKIAYKQKIKQYHPDKVADMGKEIQNLAKIRTQQINSAYQFLKKERNFK